MIKYLAAFVTAATVMVVIDLFWLMVLAKPLYQRGIGHLMADKPNLVAAVIFYLIFITGLLMLAVLPTAGSTGIRNTLIAGALFGFFTYATYDLTNLATLKNWPLGLSLIDMAWGTMVSAVSAVAAKVALDYFS